MRAKEKNVRDESLCAWSRRQALEVREQWPDAGAPLVSPRIAWAVAVLVYVGGFGAGVAYAVSFVVEPYIPRGYRTWSAVVPGIVEDVAPALAVIGLALIVCRHLAHASWADLGFSWPRGKYDIGVFLGQFMVYLVALLLSAAVPTALGLSGLDYPRPSGMTVMDLTLGLISSVQAGFAEEILLVVVPVVMLRAARQPWWRIVTFCLIARLAFHIYYGWPSLGLLIWASIVLLLFVRFRMAWPLIIMHALQDVQATLTVGLQTDVYVVSYLAGVMSASVTGLLLYSSSRLNRA